jgi:hypothetical protein
MKCQTDPVFLHSKASSGPLPGIKFRKFIARGTITADKVGLDRGGGPNWGPNLPFTGEPRLAPARVRGRATRSLALAK